MRETFTALQRYWTECQPLGPARNPAYFLCPARSGEAGGPLDTSDTLDTRSGNFSYNGSIGNFPKLLNRPGIAGDSIC